MNQEECDGENSISVRWLAMDGRGFAVSKVWEQQRECCWMAGSMQAGSERWEVQGWVAQMVLVSEEENGASSWTLNVEGTSRPKHETARKVSPSHSRTKRHTPQSRRTKMYLGDSNHIQVQSVLFTRDFCLAKKDSEDQDNN